MKLAVRIKYFCFKSKKYFNHSHFKTNTALRIKFHALYIFSKILKFFYINAQIHPYVTVQHLKSIPFVQKAWKTCVHTSVSDKISRLLKLKVLVEWLQFVYEMVAILVQTIIQKKNESKIRNRSRDMTKIITLRRPCEMLGRLRRPMIEWRHETVRWRH